MKLLILAILHKEFPQLLRKMNAKFLTLRKHFPDAQCYIIGNGDPGSMSEYAFKYIHNVWPEDQLACCENLMESLQPDLVYWRYPCAHPRLLDILERFPNVVFEHNTIEEMELKGEARKLELNLGSQILSRCAGIVGVTKEIVEYERTRSGRDLPAFVLPNSLNIVPSDKKVSHKASFAPSEVLQVLMVAVFDNWHGADRLIEGIAKSADKTRFALHLAGIGPSLPLYEKLIQRHGLQKQVFLHGWLDEKHLQNLYGNCHIAVGALGLIRKGMKEASAIKLREAATHGLPIILAGTDPDFSSELPFVHVVPNDESPLDLDAVYDFVKKWSQVPDGAIRIQDYASKKLTWTSRSVGWADFLRTLKPATVTSEASLSAQYNARPMFSIIMPCYRHAQYMPESIASLAAQNFKDIEVIIINDGSPDNTSEVARELIATWPQLNIRLLEQENMGLSEARNAGIRMARGHWILALDSDDKLAEGFLEAASRTIAENQHISLVAGMVCEFGERQSDWCYTNYNKTTLPNENTITCTAAYRRSLWETVEGYDPSNPWGWEDWHLWLRARKYGWVPFMINHPMLHYRIHLGVSMTDRLKTSLNEVSALHYTMLGNDYGINSILAAHITLQGMNQESLLRIKGKNRRFPDLPMPWFWIGLQHEGRGELDEALVCYIKAKHLDKSLQNKIDYGLQWQVEHRLYSLYSAKELHKKAAIARATLEKLKPEFKALLAEQDRLVNLATTATQTDKKRILLMCESFWPANNDNATFLEQTGFFFVSEWL